MRIYLALSVLLLSASSAIAVSFDWAVIGNLGNQKDTHGAGYGSVGYEYSISKTEVTTAQYVEFLNAVAATDTKGLYNTNMADSTFYKGISRTGSPGSYVYSANAGWENRPVVYVSWYDTLRFANWLHNGQITGEQDNTTTEYGAYDMSQGALVVRLTGADYWLPSEDEWYKAAYYDPVEEVYYDYAAGSNTPPNNNEPDNDTGNSANYNNNGYTLGSPYYTTEVGAYDKSQSPYGTYDQSGNVWEWTEAFITGGYRGLRGGSWSHYASHMSASNRSYYDLPTYEYDRIGFRIASSFTGEEQDVIPEPASIGLVLLSATGLVLRRARKS
ncbi:MAG: SUMF1/EgtB/PvdO family nonheme iron enzyme [Candidatus Auribacterota bacterium]|nr:SUMF1/EgtB/PvdO family nonheme iron enzyme [Candidatus Auribacterota bacterium]